MGLQDRRRFLQALGLGAAVTLADGPGGVLRANAPPFQTDSFSDLRSHLLSKRQRIRSLRLLCHVEVLGDPRFTESSAWLLEGTSLFLHRDGSTRLEHYRNGFDLIEIRNRGRYLQQITQPRGEDQVLYRGPATSSRRPAHSLSRMLPVPRNAPLYDAGIKRVQGGRARVLGQDLLQYFVPLDRDLVVQVDRFFDATTVRERVRFFDFQPTGLDVDIPIRMESLRFDRQGNLLKTFVLTMSDVEINPDLPKSLFSIEGVLNHG